MSYATASTSMQAAGLGMSVAGSYYSARLAKLQANREADIAEQNARIAELGAQNSLLAGQQEGARVGMKYGALKSSQRVALAANGVDLGEGSAAEIQASTDLLKELDLNTIEANAVRSAWGYRTQGTNYQNEAMVKRSAAGMVKPGMAAASSLLTGASQVAGNLYMMKKAGMLNSPQAGNYQVGTPGYSGNYLYYDP